jgi:hypothetical protein
MIVMLMKIFDDRDDHEIDDDDNGDCDDDNDIRLR